MRSANNARNRFAAIPRQDYKRLFIPYDADDIPRIVRCDDEFNAASDDKTQTEGYSISPELSLLCHIHYMGEPNPHLIDFGMNYPGPCLITREINEKFVDVDNELYEKLGEIFEADRKQRIKHFEDLKEAGFNIIRI